VADVALVLDVIAGYDPADPGTAESLGRVPASYTAFLQVDGLRGARLGIVADLLVCDPEDEEVAVVIRRAVAEMRAQGAEVIEIRIPNLPDLLAETFSCVIHEEFRHDLDDYLAGRTTIPVHSLAEIVASGQFHPGVEDILRTTLSVDMDTKEYYEKLSHRAIVRRAALAAMADHKLDALVYPTVRRKAVAIGVEQVGVNCYLSAHSGLPAITVPAGFTEDGLPVGVELLGKSWSEDVLLRLAYAFEQATHYRRPPAYAPRDWR
jgi:Asp-tRNA(Asn)/Glu-tRNA(Gln) amidotransferase A subunit family amidase